MATAIADKVVTKKVTGRRKVRYKSYDEVLADVERLAGMPTRTLGNWTFPQILDHMARSLNGMIDGLDFAMPMPLRWVMRKLMMKKMTTVEIPPGFKIPASSANMLPDETDLQAALESFRVAVGRAKSESKRAMHPGFGNISRADWDGFQLRHFEMHMSFVVPE